MARCKVLAFLLCESASRGADGKVTLHGLFDRMIIPATATHPKVFFVYYKVVVNEPCTVSLQVIDPAGHEIPGNWRDPLPQIGPVQAIWALWSSLFKQPGSYRLQLRQDAELWEQPPPPLLAATELVVGQG
jgi:hypothetical protein